MTATTTPSGPDNIQPGNSKPDNSESPTELPEGNPDLALVQLRRFRDAAVERGERRQTGRMTARARTEARVEELKQRRRASPGASDRDPAMVGGIFDRLIRDRGWSTPVAVGSVLTRWAELVGPEIALHCTPESFENSVVRVRTSSTAWATQLRLISSLLLQKFDDELGPGVVSRIEVLGPSAPSWRKGPRTVRGGRGPRDTYG